MPESTSESRLPRPNVYGWLAIVSLLSGSVVLTAGGSSLLGAGLLAFAVIVVWIAMRQDGSRTESSEKTNDEDGPSDNQKKAQAQADASSVM